MSYLLHIVLALLALGVIATLFAYAFRAAFWLGDRFGFPAYFGLGMSLIFGGAVLAFEVCAAIATWGAFCMIGCPGPWK